MLPTAAGSTITADKANGFDLPDWLIFDETTLTFTGTLPENYVGSVPVRIDIGASAGAPAFALIRDVVIDETLELGSGAGFSLTVADELINLFRPEDFYGSFAIEYYARDVKGAISDDPAIIVINVVPQRELPDAEDDTFGIDEDGTLEITLAELLANDVDDDGDHIHITNIGTVSNGSLTVKIPEISIELSPVDGLLEGATHSAALADGSALPVWLSIDPATGLLFGTPPLEAHEILSIIVTSNDANGDHEGTVQIDVDGNDGVTLTYVTEPEFSGAVTFNYTAFDDSEGTDIAEVLINVAAVNDPPVAEDDDVQGVEDTILIIDPATLLANDTDIDGDILRVSSVLNATNGTVELVAGEIRFTPDHNFDGNASFDYIVTDDVDGDATGHVNVEIISNNTAPVTVLDTFNGIEDTPFIITLADLLGNDSDPDGDAITFVEFEAVSGDGQVFELPDGSYALTPRDNINGDVAFTYRVTDGRLNSEETGNIVVNFAAVNDTPVATDDGGYVTDEDTAIAIDLAELMANDSDIENDTLMISSVLDPVNGTVEIIGGQAIFTPRADYFGNGGFSYQVSDGNGGLDTGFVSISVTSSEDLPVAVSDSGWIIDEDTSVIINPADLLTNDFDPDGDTVIFTGATGAGVEVLGDGNIRYTPGVDQNGIFNLSYTISDGNNPDVIGQFSVEVRPIDDNPTARDDSFAGVEDETLIIPIAQLTANDNDVDGHSFVVTSLSNAIGGTISFDGAGNIQFTPDQDRDTTASFEYTLTDISGATDTATVEISLLPVNDAPTIDAIAPLQGSEDTLFTAQLSASLFNDVDGDILSISVRKADGSPLPTWLTFISGTNVLSGHPPADFNGILELEVVASDGFIATTSVFSLIINSINDAPIVANALADQSSSEDEAVSFILPADAFSDVDGDALSLSASLADGSALPVWLSFDAASRIFSGTPPLNFNGAIVVSVTASDGTLETSDTFTLDITSVNDAPVVANALADQSSSEDEAVSFVLPADAFSDVDGDALSLSASLADGSALPVWLSFDAASRTFSGTPPLNFNGAIAVSVTASDGTLEVSDGFTLDITSVNDAPVVANALADQSSSEDEAVSFILPADAFSDVDGDALSLSASLADGSALPVWLSFDAASRTFSGTPPLNFNGAIAVSVTASDGTLEVSDGFTLDITSVNDAPVAIDDIISGAEDVPVVIPIMLLLDNDSDVDSNNLTISGLTSMLGHSASFDGVGNIVAISDTNFNGQFTIDYTLSDGELSDTGTITIDIAPVNDQPVVQSISDVNSDEDTAIDFTLPAGFASDVDGDNLTITAARAGGFALPAWLIFDAAILRFSGIPPQDFVGTISLQVTASDGTLSATSAFDMIIDPVNDAPTISMPFSDRFVDEDEAFNVQLQQGLFTDVDGDALTYSFALADGSALPTWLIAEAGLLKLSGQAPTNFNGSMDIRVTASDGVVSVSDVFAFTINPVNDAPHVDNPLPDLPIDPTDPTTKLFTGEVFAIDIPADTFADVDGDPLQFAALLGGGSALPSWVSFDGTTLSGTAPDSAVGTMEIQIRATDGFEETFDAFNVTFELGNFAPVAVDDGPFDARGEVPISIPGDVLLLNDYDADGDLLDIVGVGQGAHGSVSLDANDNIVYTADSGFIGNDQFIYQLSDGIATVEGTVSVTVADPYDSVQVGSDANDFLFAGRGDDYISGGAGNDFILSGRGDDYIDGGAGDDFLFAGAGSDFVDGGDGNDVIFGGRGQDTLYGGNGNDIIFGGRGNDTIIGGKGDDLLFGGRGSDVFQFSTGDGSDTIFGYQAPRTGRRHNFAGDQLHLSIEGVNNFDDLLATAQQQNGGVLFDFGNGDEIFLLGTQLSALDRDTFTFF